jgi:chemotaxis protein CheY-P-specific phosphatase CheC
MDTQDFHSVLRLAVRHVASCLSDLMNRSISFSDLQLEVIPLDQLSSTACDPEAETVGVYLRLGDNLPGQALFILSLDDALYVVDWLLELRPGATTHLGAMESSALAELGNIALAAFLNIMAEFNGAPLRLSPPAVIVDMLATTLEVIATYVGAVTDKVLVIKADFKDVHNSIGIKLWLLPDPALLETGKLDPEFLKPNKI